MPRDTNLILCPINLRHAKLDDGPYQEAVAMARRRGANLLVATVAPEMERNLNIHDPKAFWGKALEKFVTAYPTQGVEVETVNRHPIVTPYRRPKMTPVELSWPGAA